MITPKFSNLSSAIHREFDHGTVLGEKVAERLLAFWQRLGEDLGDDIWFTPLQNGTNGANPVV